MKTYPTDKIFKQHHGLTKLEYFAGQAMQGLLSSSVTDRFTLDKIAEYSATTARLLIDELNKEQA